MAMKRRSSYGSGGLPLASARQEKLAGRPASASAAVSAAPGHRPGQIVELKQASPPAHQTKGKRAQASPETGVGADF
jgi:hypothetical protein